MLKRISQRHISLIFKTWAAAEIPATTVSEFDLADRRALLYGIERSPPLHLASLSREAHQMEAP